MPFPSFRASIPARWYQRWWRKLASDLLGHEVYPRYPQAIAPYCQTLSCNTTKQSSGNQQESTVNQISFYWAGQDSKWLVDLWFWEFSSCICKPFLPSNCSFPSGTCSNRIRMPGKQFALSYIESLIGSVDPPLGWSPGPSWKPWMMIHRFVFRKSFWILIITVLSGFLFCGDTGHCRPLSDLLGSAPYSLNGGSRMVAMKLKPSIILVHIVVMSNRVAYKQAPFLMWLLPHKWRNTANPMRIFRTVYTQTIDRMTSKYSIRLMRLQGKRVRSTTEINLLFRVSII